VFLQTKFLGLVPAAVGYINISLVSFLLLLLLSQAIGETVVNKGKWDLNLQGIGKVIIIQMEGTD
jgi:hypothetical protein